MTVGIAGCLIFGLGMCFVLQILGGETAHGVTLGICGLIIMLFAYTVYRLCFEKAKGKYRQRILELAAELCGEKKENGDPKEGDYETRGGRRESCRRSA